MENRERGARTMPVRQRYELMAPYLNEQLRRAWAAAEALTLGRGGNASVAEAMGSSRTTLTKAKHEVLSPTAVPRRQRRPGGGRKLLAETDAGLLDAWDALIEPSTRGEPESPLRWTCKSTSHLAAALSAQGHPISQRTVDRLLEALGSSLQANRKTQEGADPPDRDAQFLFLYRQVRRYQRKNLPVSSVETKQKEKLGNWAQHGRDWEPQGRPTKVQTYDFPDPQRGHARPYGIDDLTRNEGWVKVGISRDTAQCAVESIRRWWHEMGHERYPQARELLLTADGGGSQG